MKEIPNGALSFARILQRSLETEILEIRARIQSGTSRPPARGAGRHWPFDSDSPFGSQPNYAVLYWVIGALLFAASGTAQATTFSAASPSLADVRAAIASAADGDTVIVPTGTAAWTSTLRITKAITIQGETTTDIPNGTANDQTVIIDNLVRISGGQPFFNLTAGSGQEVRITGITFTGQGGSQQSMPNGAIWVNTMVPFRIDHCHFTYLAHSPMVAIYGANLGVADHNVFDHFTGGNFSFLVDWNTQNGDWGDGSWAQPTGFGGPNFFFIEDNYIYNDLTGQIAAGGVDGFFGGKYAFRYNRVWNAHTFGHSTGSTYPRGRGVRAKEIYNNEYHFTSTASLSGTTGGPLLAHDNRFYGTLVTGWGLQVYRACWSYGPPFNGANGTSPWDINDAHGLYESGTATSASNTAITDTSKNWTADQWAGYSVKRPSDGATALIISNTSNTLQIASWLNENWSAGNTYEIRKVLIILDQPGRGKGDLIDVSHPAWPNQQSEPCYSWNNIHYPGGEHLNLQRGSGSQTIRQGRDYFNDTPMPGYTPYVYPHPLTTSQPRREPTASSPQQAQKKKKKWGKAKKLPASEMAQP